MAFVLPVIAAVGTVSSAMAAIGTGATVAAGIGAAVSTVSGFLSVAGGVLAGVGALTGKKDLVKLGSIFSIGSAAAGALGFGGAATGIGAAAPEASGLQGAAEAVQSSAGAATGEGLQASAMSDGIKGFGDSAAMKAPVDYGLASPTNTGNGLMMQKAQQLAQSAAQPSSLVASAGGASAPVGGAVDYSLTSLASGAKPLPAGAAGITQNDLMSVWDKGQAAAKRFGQFVKDNKELVSVVGGAADSMYGPEAQLLDLKKDQFGYQRSLMEQARRNLNTPIRLSTQPG